MTDHTDLIVEKMSCGKCAARVTKAIQTVAPGAEVKIDLPTGAVSVTPPADVAALAQAVTEAGYPARAA
jgi:copper chaperone CopZ